MKALIPGLFAVLAVQFAHAQKSPIKFGDIPMSDMTMKIYPEDSSASAVVLTDYGEAYISVRQSSVTLNVERHVRIKILNKTGFSWADVAIPLYHIGAAEEHLKELKASTYNLENDRVVEIPLSDEGIFKEKFNNNINLQKFTLSNVKEGSVIEYSYTLVSEFLANFPNWQFQNSIPVRHSEYWAIFPEYFTFQKYVQGYLHNYQYEIKYKNGAEFQTELHHWTLKNAPAFKAEPFMTCEDDYLSKVNLALSYISFRNSPIQEIMGSWSKLNSRLLEDENFGDAIRGSNFLTKKVEELTANITDPQQTIATIFDYVRQTIEWNGIKDMYAGNLKKVFEQRTGTVADINISLAAMLQAAGLSVDMVLLSTRDHGFVREPYPMEKQFNYTVCAVQMNGKTILLDATERFAPLGVLPKRCLNGKGLIISSERHGWINLESKTKAKTVISSELLLDKYGELSGQVTYNFDGYDGQNFRNSYSHKGEKQYLKEFEESKNWEIKKSEFQNVKDIGKIASQKHEVVINDHVTTAGNTIYINPYITSQLKENVFKSEKREYPVDFGNMEEKTYMIKITIPDGYIVDELPTSKIISLPENSARFTYSVSQNSNVINMLSSLQVNKSLFVQDEYPNLREFYNHVVAKQSEQIVLKKKQ